MFPLEKKLICIFYYSAMYFSHLDVFQIAPYCLVEVERDLSSISRRYPRLSVSPEFSKVGHFCKSCLYAENPSLQVIPCLHCLCHPKKFIISCLLSMQLVVRWPKEDTDISLCTPVSYVLFSLSLSLSDTLCSLTSKYTCTINFLVEIWLQIKNLRSLCWPSY